MPAKEHTKTIGKHQYKYVTMTMTPAVEMLGLLASTVGEALAPLSNGGIAKDGEIDPGVVANVATALLAKLGKSDDVLDIIGRLNKQGMVVIVGDKGQKTPMQLEAIAELHFGENFGELSGWLAFALGAQFSPFFASLLGPGLGAALATMIKAQTEKALARKGILSPTTSAPDGQSSAS